MNIHHRAALAVVAAAAVLDQGLGAAFGAADHVGVPDGLYFAVVTVTTVGYGDIIPRGWAAHVLALAIMVLAIPLWSASFALLTSGLAARHIAESEARMRAHLEERLRHHLSGREVMPRDPPDPA